MGVGIDNGGLTFDFVVGSNYPVFYRGQSAPLQFIGHVQDRRGNNVLLFFNPTGVGLPYQYIGAQPRVIWPDVGTTTTTLTFRLHATYVGQTRDSLTLITSTQAGGWGSGV